MPRGKLRDKARLDAIAIRFAREYVANGRNGTRAYMACFPRARPDSARASCHEWLAKPSVVAEIERLTQEIWEQKKMSAQEALGRLADLVRSDVADFFWKPGELDSTGAETVTGTRKPIHELTPEQRYAISSVKYDARGRVIYETVDKGAQIGNMLKHHKLLTDKVDLSMSKKLEDIIAKSFENPGAEGA